MRGWFPRFVFLTIGSVSIAYSVLGQEKIIVNPETIIDLARNYYGREEALQAVQTIYYEGEILDPKGERKNGLVRIFLKKPYFQRMEIQMGRIVTVHCVNGIEGYHLQADTNSGRKKISVLPAKRVEELMISSFENLNFLRNPKDRPREVKYLGEKEYQGEPCYKVLFQYGSGIHYTRLIHAKSGRVVMTIDHQGVEMHHRGEVFSKGIRFTKILETYKDNQHINSLDFGLVLLNKEIPDSFFDFPNL
jgi:hypothetical protein